MDTLYAINEAKFKSVEDAKNAYDKLQKDDDFFDWFKTFLKSLIVILCAPPILIPVIQGCTRWIASPNSIGEKINRCDKLIKECNKFINNCDDEKKINEVKKIKKDIEKTREKLIEDEKKINNKYISNIKYASMKESLHIPNITNSIYNYSCIYEDYINNKIDNEEKIANHLNNIIPMNESAYKQVRAINEAKISDKIKNRFNKIVAFVKNLLAKFMESVSNLLLDEKGYLEKYKDIILKKQPKEENEYSYTGDYTEAKQRCINFQLPVFNYNQFATKLEQEDNDKATYECVYEIMKGKNGFKFSNGDSVGDQFKEYFLAIDKGEKSGKFNDGHLNFTDMYNFCKNIKEIENIKKKDENYIETTTKSIMAEIEKRINNNTTSTNNQQQQTNQNSSYIDILGGKYITEADDNQSQGGTDNNKDTKPTTASTVRITSAVSKVNQDSKDRQALDQDQINQNANGSENDKKDVVTKASDRFLSIVRTIIAARCTALETIAKNYMAIIRAHVRSYVGNEADKTTNRTPDSDIDYNNNNQNNNNNNQNNNNNNNQNNNNNDQNNKKNGRYKTYNQKGRTWTTEPQK